MKILCQTGDDLFVMAQQLRQTDKHLDEMEMASNATEPNIRQLKKLIETIDQVKKDKESHEEEEDSAQHG